MPDTGIDEEVRSDISVLNLVTSADANFFVNQIRTLEALDVQTTTIPVPERGSPLSNGTSRSALDYLRQFRLLRKQPLDRYDVLHANYALTAPAALAQRQLPVVLSLWGSDVNGRLAPVSRACASLCDEVIVMSESMRLALGCDCRVIPHGVDLETFRPISRETARERVGWDPDHKHVFFPYPTGRDVKDYPRAVRVVSSVRDRLDVPVELQVAGGGIPHTEMSTFYSAADALLLTSKHEGSPNVVKEALACNLPVVATDVGDVAERLDGVDPSYVGQDDSALVDALETVLRRGERSNGRSTIEALDIHRVAARIRSVYEEVLKER